MSHLNLAQTPDIDLHNLDSKNKLLIEDYATELRAVVRYLFKGQVVPQEIQEHCKVLFPKLEDIHTWTRLKMPENELQYGIKTVGNKERSVNIFEQGTWVKTLRIRLTRDLAWGNHPLWEIVYDNTLYREVPYNGNVYSHLLHQHPWYVQKYLTSLADAHIITDTQKELLTIFHRIHDLPEMNNGDHFAPDKHEGHIEEDAHAIWLILDYANVEYTLPEKTFIQWLFTRFEGNDTIFKPGEIINYFRDALNVFDHRQFYAHDAGFALSIFNNYFPRFLDRTHTVTLLPEDKLSEQRSTLPLQDIPLAKVFFQENVIKINHIIDYGITHIDELASIPEAPFKSIEQLHHLNHIREELKSVYGISA